jgi:RimJ/RimL family protein N-acetyltransferase
LPHPHWPLFDLVIRTPRLEVRLPDDDTLLELIEVAAAGVHDPDWMPFAIPWTDQPSPLRERASLKWWWGQRAGWEPESWSFTGAVFVGGRPVGVQDMSARNFARLRSVTTGSWLGREHHGRGIGQEMRAAVLHLAFEGLGAEEALSGAWHDNAPSLGVSRKLGYRENGRGRMLRRGVPDEHVGLRLTREDWLAQRREDIEIIGLEPCLEMFGATP